MGRKKEEEEEEEDDEGRGVVTAVLTPDEVMMGMSALWSWRGVDAEMHHILFCFVLFCFAGLSVGRIQS